MSKRPTIIAGAALTGLLITLTPALAQNQGSTTGSQSAGAPLNEGQGSGQSGQNTNRGTLPRQSDERTGPGQGTARQGQETGNIGPQDRRFVANASTANMAEIELGRLALERAASADVKTFAQRMIDDHTLATQQMAQIARQGSVTLPTALTAEQKNHRDKLSRASGAEFDRQYMSHMVKDHQKTISDFENQAQRGDNQALRAFAQQTLPTLREHLRLAQDIASRVGAQTNNGHSGH